MIYRKAAKIVSAALVAALLIGSGGMSAVAQQSYGVVSTPCANCYQPIGFPTTNVSSVPVGSSEVIYPAGQVVYSSPVTQSLPTTSTYAAPYQTVTYPSESYPAVTYPTESYPATSYPTTSYPTATYPTESYPTVTYPRATYASGTQAVNQISNSQPVGTFTSIPATTYSSTPTVSWVQPTTIATQPVYYSTAPAPVRTTTTPSAYRVGTVTSGLAQSKAQQAANGGIRGHLGGGLGGARYEGVGWSSRGPQDAIQQCCYWGTRPTAQIGVSQGADGVWYACVLYN